MLGLRALPTFRARDVVLALAGSGVDLPPELLASAFNGVGPSGKPRAPALIVKQSP